MDTNYHNTYQDEGPPYISDKAIHSERDFLVRVLDYIDTLVVVLDGEGNIIRINRACERLFGYSDPVMREKLTTGILRLPSPIGVLHNLIEILRSNGNRENYETEWTDISGIKRTIAWTINTSVNKNGQLEYVFASGIDITARKNAEYLLRRERTLLKSLINSIPDMIFYKDLNGKYQGCNSVFERLSGKVSKEIVGHTDTNLYGPDRKYWYSEVNRHVIETGKTFTYDNWMNDIDGEKVLIETRLTPFYSDSGDILGVIGVGRDITRHYEVEQQILAAKSEFEQLISSLSSVMVATNLVGVITHWNPMAETVFGVPASEAIGKKINNLSLNWDWNSIQIGIAECLKDQTAVYLKPILFKRSKSRDGYLGVSISPLYDNQQNHSGYILLCSDITDRKALESQLAQAQKLESIGRLAAGIAHEINTPVQYIGDNIRFLQTNFNIVLDLLHKYKTILESFLEDEPADHNNKRLPSVEIPDVDLDFLIKEIPISIKQSLEGVQRVTEIVRAMREFSHPGLKEKILMDINKALMDTLTVTRNQWKLVADIDTDLAPDLPKVMGQPAEVNQVFLNIIINAAQAIGDAIEQGNNGLGIITIATRQIDERVEIRISDTGNGIPADVQPHIFDPFFTTKDVGKGTGQGLALSYDIVVKKHCGSLSFETAIDEGTTFIIQLPVGC